MEDVLSLIVKLYFEGYELREILEGVEGIYEECKS